MIEGKFDKVDRDGHEFKGLVDRGQVQFICSSCQCGLMSFQIGKDNDDLKDSGSSKALTRVAVRCEECGGYSNIEQIGGIFYPGAANDDMAFDVIDSRDHADAPECDVLFSARRK